MCYGKEGKPPVQALCGKSHFVSLSDRGMDTVWSVTTHWGSEGEQYGGTYIYSADIKTQSHMKFQQK